MIGRRIIAFFATLPVLSAVYLFYGSLTGIWSRPTTTEAAATVSFYLGIFFAVLFAIVAVACFGFPSAIAADRLFQRGRRRPFAPYGFFVALSAIVTVILMLTLDGTKHLRDFPVTVFYFTVCASIIWKVGYEFPKKA